MKKKIILLGCLTFFIYLNVDSQSNKTTRIEYAKDSIPSLIIFNTDVEKYKHSDGIELIKDYLKLSNNDSFRSKKSFSDEYGFFHERFQHYYKGLLVEFSEYNIHSSLGEITSISGNLRKIKDLDIKPKLNEEDALSSAINQLNVTKYMWENNEMEDLLKKQQNDPTASYYPKGDLLIWTDWNSDKVALTYKFKICSYIPLEKNYVYIDAHTGLIIDKRSVKIDAIGTADTRYCGTQSITTTSKPRHYILYDATRNIETWDLNTSYNIGSAVPFTDRDNYWSAAQFHNPEMDDAALNAHFAAGKTYDYFQQSFLGRNGWDGDNSPLSIYIHWGIDENNGYWEPDYNYIFLGDGDGTEYDPWADLDAVAHEFAHGIYDDEVGYNYTGEPGAIEEGLSDIWAACVENYASLVNHNPWLMFENFELNGHHRRYLADPDNALYHYHINPYQPGLQYPDVYQGDYWFTNTDPEMNSFYVHVNSTVMSHWFYLLSQGGYDTNSEGACYRVLPIGITDAARIVYRMERAYLTTSSTFSDVRTLTIYAAENIFGQNSLQSSQVKNAWHAVGIGNPEYKVVGPTLVCSPNTISYSLNYLPAGSIIDWTPGPNIQQISPDNSNPCTFSFSGQGYSYINATINYGCGNVTAIPCYIWIGTPVVDYVTGPYSGEPYTMYYFTAYPHSWDAPAQATYYWNVSPWADIYPDYSGANIIFYESVGHQVWVYANNSCGSSNTAYTWIEISGGWYYSVSPNPADNEITVTVNEPESPPQNVEEPLYNVSIFNMYGALQSQGKYSGDKFSIPVHNLMNGNYIIKISNGKSIVNKHLIIKH